MKIIPPRSDGTHSGVSRPSAFDRAKEAAIEKKKSLYILLVCGHMTTWEEDEFYSVYRPRAIASYCEQCCKWIDRAPKPTKPALPTEPLF